MWLNFKLLEKKEVNPPYGQSKQKNLKNVCLTHAIETLTMSKLCEFSIIAIFYDDDDIVWFNFINFEIVDVVCLERYTQIYCFIYKSTFTLSIKTQMWSKIGKFSTITIFHYDDNIVWFNFVKLELFDAVALERHTLIYNILVKLHHISGYVEIQSSCSH